MEKLEQEMNAPEKMTDTIAEKDGREKEKIPEKSGHHHRPCDHDCRRRIHQLC